MAPRIAVQTDYVSVGHDEAGNPVHYVAADERTHNGVIVGEIGSGKTRLADLIACSLDANPAGWTVARVDGDAWSAQEPSVSALFALDEAEQHADAFRLGEVQHRHLVVWDGLEWLTRDQTLWRADFTRRIERLARLGPRYGVGQLATVVSSYASSFGGSTMLRGLLSLDNLFVLRTREPIVFNADGDTLQPSKLPRGGGHGYLIRDEQATRFVVTGGAA